MMSDRIAALSEQFSCSRGIAAKIAELSVRYPGVLERARKQANDDSLPLNASRVFEAAYDTAAEQLVRLVGQDVVSSLATVDFDEQGRVVDFGDQYIPASAKEAFARYVFTGDGWERFLSLLAA